MSSRRPSPAEFVDTFPMDRRPPSTVAVVIPAWQPQQPLLALVSELWLAGIRRLVLVDDGSTASSRPVFDALGSLDGVEVLRHSDNYGKGRALKWAFRHVLTRMPEIRGVVTADADGQHLPEDVVAVARRLAANPERAVFGVRSFGSNVPWRSRIGNRLTRKVFQWLTGHSVRDTQTGLRGLPVALLPELLALPGERYEYESLMLAHLCQSGCPPLEEPIRAVYFEGNRSSHFKPLQDGLRVYLALLRAGFRRSRARQAAPRLVRTLKPDDRQLHVA